MGDAQQAVPCPRAIRSRSVGIDAVRVVGLCAVIFGHTFAGVHTHQFIYAWHVPLFFVITGYLWAPGRTIGHELRARRRALAVPYLGWFILVAVVWIAWTGPRGATDFVILLPPLWGGASGEGLFGTFWFVSVLFFAAILFRLVERVTLPRQWALAVLGLTAGYLLGGWLAATPLAVGSAIPCMIFLLAGRTLRQHESRISHPVVVGASLIGASLVAIAIVPLAPIDIKHGSFGTPILSAVLAVTISSGMLLIAKGITVGPRLGRSLSALAIVGIAVVLFHPTILTLAKGLGLPKSVVLLAVMVIPWAIALLLHRTSSSSILIGASRSSHAKTLRAKI